MDDTISRQDAITIPILPVELREYQTMNLDDAYELGWFDCQNCIEDLPTAQSEIIRCKDCKWFNRIGCAINMVDDSVRPGENDFCSFAERKDNELV